MSIIENLKRSVSFLQENGITEVDAALIMGTGLGDSFVESVDIIQELSYRDIPNMPEATVEFHHGKVIYASYEHRKLLIFKGRFHYYEGHSMSDVVYPVRLAKLMGAKYLLMSNAGGAVAKGWKKGELMLLEDHIDLQPENPLRGKNLDDLGPRFPDMSAPYDEEINKLILKQAASIDVVLHHGVYASVPGPNLETRAEYRYLQRIGADAVGMSTVPEVIAAVHCGLPCAVISVLTDECDPENLQKIDIEEIIEIAGKAEPKVSELFLYAIRSL